MESVVEMYQSGAGLKTIHKLSGRPVTSLKRDLQRAGIYKGTSRPRPRLEDFPTPRDLASWAIGSQAECRWKAGGFVVEFHGIGEQAMLTCPLPTSGIGKTITLSARFRLLNASMGTLEMGICDSEGSDTVSVALQRSMDVGEAWHVKRLIRGVHPVLFMKGNQLNATVAHVSNVKVEEE